MHRITKRGRPPGKSAEEKFFDYIDKDEATGCWNWIGGKDKNGYGIISVYLNPGRVCVRAHRFSYELYKGSISLGMFICHSCDNPSCVNPDHLWLGTHLENEQDKDKKDRRPRGHIAHNRKLTQEQILKIRNTTISAAKLAKEFGVSDGLVCRVRNNPNYCKVES
jgi:hypothetical protein